MRPTLLRSGDLLVAAPVQSMPGYVYSPFVEGGKMVDVRKFRPGKQALCPYTMRRFVVPGRAPVAPVSPVANPQVVRVDRPAPNPVPVRERPVRGRLLVASPVQNKTGYVYSPHANGKRMVDVRKFRAGDEVLCPYTMKRFVVPNELLVRQRVAELRQEQEATAGGGIVELSQMPMVASTGRDLPPSVQVGSPRREVGGRPPVEEREKPRTEPRPVQAPPSAPMGGTLPAGTWVEGRPGFVVSPYAKSYQLVDVTGIAAGTEVKCPYTGKNFRVPEVAGAGSSTPPVKPEAKSEPKPEPKVEGKPKPSPVKSSIPTASWSSGSPGYVQSPFGKKGQLVDVTGFSAGTIVECPFTHKDFRVPAAKGSQ